MVRNEELALRAVKRFSPCHTAACEFVLPGPIMGQLANRLSANQRSLVLKMPVPRSSGR